ncbi:MAG: TolC family protein [Candidatus Latescibacteria bacterium]|nr:TolC family protein [Candidatus Latescibacterota bacterium]
MFAMIRLTVIMASWMPLAVYAQPPQPLALQQLIVEALDRSPALKAAENRRDAATYRRPQVTELADPMFSYTRWISTPETRVGPQTSIFRLSQRIPYPGKRSLRGDLVDEAVNASESQRHIVSRDVTYQMSKAYYDLYAVERSIEILDNYMSTLLTFTRVAEEKYATGTGSQASVLKSQVEASTIMARRLAFEGSRGGLAAAINALRDRPADLPVETGSELGISYYVIPESLLVEQALKNRQELQIVDAHIRRSDIVARASGLAFRPDLEVQAAYITVPKKSNTITDSGKDAFSIMLGLNIPFRRAGRRAAELEAKAEEMANRMDRSRLENLVRAEVSDIYQRATSTAATLRLYDQGMMALAESSLESALAGYQSGTVDFLNLLDAERTLLKLRLDHIRELAQYRKYIAGLERAVGGDLPGGR